MELDDRPPVIISQEATLARLLDLSRSYKTAQAFNIAGFRGARDFFDLLVALQCLDRHGDGKGAVYRNNAETAPYLIKGCHQYIGGILALNTTRSYVQMEYLEQCLRDGCLPDAARQRLPDIMTTFRGEAHITRDFAYGMLGASLGNFTALARQFNFSRFTSVGDIGGSTGCLCVAVCRQHAQMNGCTYDLPGLHDVAVEYVTSHGMQERVKVADLDFFSAAPFPTGHDVLTLGMVLHDMGINKKLALMRKAFEALPAGGVLIVVENLIDDDRRVRCNALAMSLEMLCEFGQENAFDFSFQEFTSWALQVGFHSTEVMQLGAGTAYAAVAHKSS